MHSPSKVGGHSRFELHIPTLLKAIVTVAFFLFLDCSGVHAQESGVINQLKADANSGDYHAAHILATAYAVGDGVAKDSKASDYWYSVAASLHDKRTTQADTKLATTVDDSSVKENKFLFPSKQDFNKTRFAGPLTFGSANSHNTPSIDWTATSKQTTSETSVVTKTKEFLSDHIDEITDLATFLIEQYITGGEPSEGTTKSSGGAAHPSK